MYDIVIIGGGPAGLTALLYAARGGKRALLLEKLFVGGQTNTTTDIRNYPGFENGVDGFDLCQKITAQAKSFGGEIKNEDVTSIDFINKTVLTQKENYPFKAAILCMGNSQKKLGVENEDRLTGSGVSYCATCDGNFFKDKRVAVIGGGDTALFDALYLSSVCERVYLVHRREEFRAGAALVNSAREKQNIEFVLNYTAEKIVGESQVSAIVLKSTVGGENKTLEVSGIFVAVGTKPVNELAKDAVALDEAGFIITDAHMRTGEAGIFAAGDIRNTPLRQIVTACADGAVAATSAISYINGQDL